MKKSIRIYYIIIFAVTIILPNFIFALLKGHIDTANYENRTLAEAPVISLENIKNFPEEFEDYYNDRLPFRNQLISLNNRINYYLFDSTTSDTVLIGKDGWLFLQDKNQGNPLADYTGESALSDEELKQIADNLVNNERLLADAGVEFVVEIIPNKSRIYSEYMPDYMGEPAQVYAVSQIVDYLKANTDIRIVYPYDELMEDKEALMQDGITLYHKADTHWNNVGAYIGSCALLRELGIDMPSVLSDDITITPSDNDSLDLAMLLHMASDFKDCETDYEISGYDENGAKLVQDDFNGVIEYNSDAGDDRRVYIYRDSFATDMGKFVGSQFKDVYMRHFLSYSGEDLLEDDPDVFVLEVGERNAPYELSSLNIAQ